MAYDPLLRLYQVAGASTTRFLYDGADAVSEYDNADAVSEYDNAGAVLRRYVFDPTTGQPLVWYEGSGTTAPRYLSADERGSVVSATDTSGNIIGINTYDEYGRPGAANIGRYQYTGQKWLGEAALYDYKARNYLPHLGIFAQTDPMGYVDSANLYAYVRNDPINLIDSRGRVPLPASAVRAARTIFGNTVNYGAVDVRFNSFVPHLLTIGRADVITVGNIIYVSGSSNTLDNATTLHELTHVWQNQSGLYDPLQMASIELLGALTGDNLYLFYITPKSRFENYTLEQQGAIVEACARGSAAACSLLAKSNHFRTTIRLLGAISTLSPFWQPPPTPRRGTVTVEDDGHVTE